MGVGIVKEESEKVTVIPAGCDDHGHPVKPVVGGAYKRRIKHRMKRNRHPHDRGRP